MGIVVTGGAGFIGSCVVRTLNESGRDDIVIVDNIASTEKWTNLRNKKFVEYVHKNAFLTKLESGDFGKIDAIIHLGACSSTTEKNFDYLWQNNVEYTKKLWTYCSKKDIQFIYASSAATYGDGEQGFDDNVDIDCLRPLNGYGYSKQVFDQWSLKQTEKPKQYVGLKFFNVYGPNEYNKQSMASMVFHGYRQIQADGEIRLFRSCNSNYTDGGQLRDFVYVKDVCSVIMYFLNNPKYSGIFNVGTGRAQSFKELAEATFGALGIKPNIKYIDMPEELRDKYQYYTSATMEKLKNVGYDKAFMDVEAGVKDYVTNYLHRGFEIY